MKRIPLLPVNLQQAKRLAKPFYPLSRRIYKLFPTLGVQLERCELNVDASEYISISILVFIFWFILTFSSLFILQNIYALRLSINIHLAFSFLIGFFAMINTIAYPNVLVGKRVREIEKNLLFALRHLQIQIKAGVTLFDSLVSVANADYGLVSEEFRKAIKKISTGTPEIESLEELAVKNPSLYFRRVIWQIANSMRSGSDLGETLSSLVESLSNEQRIAIRKYGSQLNPLAMMYMMTAIIIPNLGVTFLLILSSLTGFGITEQIFWLILFFIALFQFFFIGIVKSRRPAMEI
ncbi:MAG: type II secretion system F family protein [Candidatus Aenigmarchaeota archaeon]|nr:type II secretion system F family protein [Candidatus Aenigmarchaeota archaeon]MCX8179337.1 type II secretion system F family protein [Candidatus Aenigmarchaeota archaeon]